MAGISHIDGESSAIALADLLNGNARRRPVVVVTIPAGRPEPWIDVEEIAREAGKLAEVYLMPTGDFTWKFSARMAEGTQVYGGAGRVYPVGHEWATDLSKSPLRFAFNAEDGAKATQSLISDTLRMAAAAGLLESLPTRELRQVGGTVKMVVAGRALVDVGNVFPAAIAEELTVDDVGIEQIVRVGQHIDGLYDAETNRIDVTKGLRASSEALAHYSPGDVVLTKVAKVRSGKAELVLYPRTTSPAVTATVLRADVTTNPADDLRTLMTIGEVIAARVVASEPLWSLALNDVDDDERVLDAPSLLVDGPPWLREESEALEVDDPPAPLLPAPPMPPPEPVLADSTVLDVAPPVAPRPSPTMFDRNRPRPGAGPLGGAAQPVASAPPAESTRALLLKIDALTAKVRELEIEQESFRTQLLAGTDEREQLRYLLDQAERRANRADNDLKAARARLRKAGGARSAAPGGDGPRFADPEQGFRYLVLTQWATRTLPSEQLARPLPDYLIGSGFLESLSRLEGVKAENEPPRRFRRLSSLRLQRLLGSGGERSERPRPRWA